MNRIKRTYVIIPLVLLISVCIGIVLVYNFLVTENIKSTIYDSVVAAFNTRTNNFKTKIIYDYEDFNRLSEKDIEILKTLDSDSYDEIIDNYESEKDIAFDKETREITFRMADKGVAFNPLNKPDPDITLSAEKREIGGLGIFITKKTMDFVAYAYENGENILTMIKKI